MCLKINHQRRLVVICFFFCVHFTINFECEYGIFTLIFRLIVTPSAFSNWNSWFLMRSVAKISIFHSQIIQCKIRNGEKKCRSTVIYACMLLVIFDFHWRIDDSNSSRHFKLMKYNANDRLFRWWDCVCFFFLLCNFA